jgi:hypothetical protein
VIVTAKATVHRTKAFQLSYRRVTWLDTEGGSQKIGGVKVSIWSKERVTGGQRKKMGRFTIGIVHHILLE